MVKIDIAAIIRAVTKLILAIATLVTLWSR
jgi:hypothetical protein